MLKFKQRDIRETEPSVVERLCKTMHILDKDKYFIPLKNALLEKKFECSVRDILLVPAKKLRKFTYKIISNCKKKSTTPITKTKLEYKHKI